VFDAALARAGRVSNPDYFNPASYAGWVAISRGDFSTATQLQNLTYQVGTPSRVGLTRMHAHSRPVIYFYLAYP
jgi:hypothetical protein